MTACSAHIMQAKRSSKMNDPADATNGLSDELFKRLDRFALEKCERQGAGSPKRKKASYAGFWVGFRMLCTSMGTSTRSISVHPAQQA